MIQHQPHTWYLVRRSCAIAIRANSYADAARLVVQSIGRFPVANLVEAPPANLNVITWAEWLGRNK